MNVHNYVYFHINPQTGNVFYVGKGKYQGSFELRAYCKFSRNAHWTNTVKKFGGFIVILVHDRISESEAFYWEKFYIKLFGRRDLKTGPLVNLTDGGEGGTLSEETCQKISERLKGKRKSMTHRENLKQSHVGMKGRSHTESTLKKMSKSKVMTDEQFAQKGKILYAKWVEKKGKAIADILLTLREKSREERRLARLQENLFIA